MPPLTLLELSKALVDDIIQLNVTASALELGVGVQIGVGIRVIERGNPP